MRISKTLVLGALFLIIFSQNAFCASEEEMGQAAEQAGKFREALTHYTAALQSFTEGSSDDQRLREKIIAIAQKLNPRPAIQEEAERYLLRGEAAVEVAVDEGGFDKAAKEFKGALRFAPWSSQGYFNLALVEEKAGRYKESIRNWKLYLLAAPNAADAKDVRAKLVKLEYKMENVAAPAAAPFDPSSLSGAWTVVEWAQIPVKDWGDIAIARAFRGPWFIMSGDRAQISVSGQTIQITRWLGGYPVEYEGILNGYNISGTVTVVPTPMSPEVARLGYRNACNITKLPFEGTISESADAIVLIEIGGINEVTDEKNRLFICESAKIHPTRRLRR